MKAVLSRLLLGFLPALVGCTMSLLLGGVAMSGMSWSVLQLGMLLLWFWAGYRLSGGRLGLWKSAAVVHLPALAALLAALFQILVLERWWQNLAGGLSQVFFAPFFLPAVSLLRLFPWSGNLWGLFLAAFTVMFAAFCLGGAVKIILKKRQGVSHDQSSH